MYHILNAIYATSVCRDKDMKTKQDIQRVPLFHDLTLKNGAFVDVSLLWLNTLNMEHQASIWRPGIGMGFPVLQYYQIYWNIPASTSFPKSSVGKVINKD